MSVSDGVVGAASLDVDQQQQQQPQAVFLQIYPRLSQDKAACCTLQVSPGATAAMVIQKAGATLGLDMTSPYALLEVRQAEGEERRLGDTEMPVERVLLWPPGARKRHPQEKGYYFILQAQGGEGALGSEMDGGGVPSLEEYDDLCSLSTLTEDTILAALRLRFYKHNIYTYARGILVAINPFKFLPIYNPKYVMMYNNQPLGKLSPHIFAVADVAYHTMLKQQENQCVVISGESGSGKTQSTNFLIHCLTALSQKGYSSGVKRTILGAGPVLEAFGNAKTAQNNNSSRFGKFIRVNYLKSGVVRGAVVEKYLLEKCRLVFRAKNERNYHVFYYLLVGASKEEQREFSLLQPEDYTYLQQEYFHLEDAEDLRHEFERLHQAMEMVGFLPSTKKQIFSMLSAILYLGNVTYTQSEDGQALEAGPADVLSTLSDLLKVKQELLVEALTKRKQTTANDKLVLHYTLKEAVTARDSMAKSLYSSLFDWIVLHINHALLNRRDMEEAVSCLSIGILDIFGFEDFQTNSFEQFCINYANEKLQYYFNQHIFKLEQKEYQAEGISWSTIDYTDNLGCIHLISQKPTGLFHLLDEESNLPQATDDTLLNKFKQQHQDNPYFVPTTVMLPAFVIQHFAGKVKYQIKDFRKKNTDHMRPDIVALLRSSERAFMRQLIGSDPVAVFRWGILRATIRIIAAFNEAGSRRAVPGLVKRTSRQSIGELKRRPSSALQRLSSHSSLLDFSFDRSDDNPLEVFEDIFANYEKKKKSKASKHKQLIPTNLMNSRSLKHIVGLTLHDRASRSLLHPHQRKKPPSISAQFQASLNKLLETVGKAEPFFIRCIRSNAEKKEMLFDNALVQQQLRYTGMLETVRIQKSGYNAKFTFTEFLEQFKVLLPKEATTAPEDIANLLQKMGLGQSTYQIGKTKVFLKEREKQHLQDTLNKEVMRHIVILQRWFRACLSRSHFLYKKDAAIRIQRCWRAFRADTRCRAATVIQAAWRGSQKRKDYLRKRNSIKKMQTLFRNKPDLNSSKAEVEKPMPPQLPSKTQSMPQPLPKLQPKHQNQPSPKHQTQHQRSLERKELRRQHSLEPSPNRSLQPGPEVNRQEATQRNTESEKREGRGSPPPLNRPLSLPHDPKVGRDREGALTSLSPHTGTLERYSHLEDIKEHAKRWKSRREGRHPEDSSPEIQRPRDKRMEGLLLNRGKSISLDNVSKLSSSGSGSDSSSSITEVRVRSRKRPNHKRRLAYARSGLMFNLKGSQESEFWSFPLPPMSPSPGVSGMGQSNQPEVHIRPRKPEVQFQESSDITTDIGRFSLPARSTNESSIIKDYSQSQPTTPERLGFFSKIMKKWPNRDSQPPEYGKRTNENTQSEKGAISPYPLSSEGSGQPHNPSIRISRAARVSEKWNASLEREITNINELRNLDEFLGNQVNELRTRAKKLSATESIFLTATMQFRETIKGMYSISKPHISYKGLMKGYQNRVSSLAEAKQQTEVQSVVNLFQSVLDGFIRGEIKRAEAGPVKTMKKTKMRGKKSKCPNSPLDHMFSTYQVNIMQSCDLCGSFIWGMEKAYMCSACKLICHKKCLSKIINACSTRCARLDDGVPGHLHFGVQVCVLTSKTYPIPMVVQMMLEHVEMNGLYTEGIYRKSGSACHARELHQLLETNPERATLEKYSIHTVTGLVKRWLRELPEPLLTFSLYNDFLHAVELPEQSEQLRAVYQKLDDLPPSNFNTLERLVFHLVRVAKEEEHNRMSANSLAIVFAPCILRSPDTTDPFLSMKDISKTTTCVEILILEQFRRYNEKMQEITELEFAEALAVNKLMLKRQNTILEKSSSELDVPQMDDLNRSDIDMESERTLIERIKSIKEEKEELACRLPELEQENFDDSESRLSLSISSESLLEDRVRSLESEGRSALLSLLTWPKELQLQTPETNQMDRTPSPTPRQGAGTSQTWTSPS
ncbi:unconventional myosin-IXb isoform X3 [Oncorhynchus mykiss]|uniref:Unconventional myosin-IXb-like n=2 Tax=Oncorhynchus mykiss TaxID=8022 RepID=A0A8C7TT67_ONCMY|nr:unconventional myosin-IXb isoform X3 [Oncorhynchus mykiss]XP_036821831.1 unconventional myosin-IXb isoform X3 [Oncorhynchus mykiss]XP_036821832.1 unconventional myosin-IXb isoform X3 [Oncorhynchus mykiss]